MEMISLTTGAVRIRQAEPAPERHESFMHFPSECWMHINDRAVERNDRANTPLPNVISPFKSTWPTKDFEDVSTHYHLHEGKPKKENWPQEKMALGDFLSPSAKAYLSLCTSLICHSPSQKRIYNTHSAEFLLFQWTTGKTFIAKYFRMKSYFSSISHTPTFLNLTKFKMHEHQLPEFPSPHIFVDC